MSVLTEIRLASRPKQDTAETLRGRRDTAERQPGSGGPGTVSPLIVRARTAQWGRLLGWLMTGAGLAMVPWLVVLALTLPAGAAAAHWNTVWVGLDGLEAVALTATGLLLRRRDPRASLTSAATAVLLLVDAWFDVLTAAPGADRATAVAMAVCAELPLSALCAVLSVRLFPRPERF